jgi:hypothetical protein
MKIFISWSGEKSRQVALLLEEWIKCVIQASQPWMSSNIERGALWFSEINDQLSSVSLGIICLTAENKNKPWILFEAGALAKGLQTNRVCTLLIDLKNEDIEQPLAQFNHTAPDKEGMWQLINTINTHIGENRLPQNILEKVFHKNWIDFEEKFSVISTIKSTIPTKVTKRDNEEILMELLYTVRSFDKRMQQIESTVANPNNMEKPIKEYDTHKILRFIDILYKEGLNKNEIFARLIKEGFAISSKSISRMVDDYFDNLKM